MRRVVGWSLTASPTVAFFAYMAINAGLAMALLVFGIVALFMAATLVGIWLVDS